MLSKDVSGLLTIVCKHENSKVGGFEVKGSKSQSNNLLIASKKSISK